MRASSYHPTRSTICAGGGGPRPRTSARPSSAIWTRPTNPADPTARRRTAHSTGQSRTRAREENGAARHHLPWQQQSQLPRGSCKLHDRPDLSSPNRKSARAKPGRAGGRKRLRSGARFTSYDGTSYPAGRLKRDHPEIAARAMAGEFTSVRAAARGRLGRQSGADRLCTTTPPAPPWWGGGASAINNLLRLSPPDRDHPAPARRSRCRASAMRVSSARSKQRWRYEVSPSLAATRRTVSSTSTTSSSGSCADPTSMPEGVSA